MSKYEHVSTPGEGLDAYMRLLVATRDAGKTRIERFRCLGAVDGDAWFRTSSNLYANETWRAFFESDAARRALPDLLEPSPFPVGTSPDFEEVSFGSLVLDGELARLLVAGGAYDHFRGPHAEAKQAAIKAADDLLQGRYEDFRLFVSNESWSPWFYDIAWDKTLILIDNRRTEVTLLVSTDSD